MIGSNVARRYAQAFFKVAGEENRYEELYRELFGFARLLEENKDLRAFFVNPIFSRTEKTEVLETIVGKTGLSALTANFLKILTDKGRIGLVGAVAESYRAMMDEALGRISVAVTTAHPLSATLAAALKESMKEATGKEVELAVRQDAGLIGGIVVKVGDKVFDGSVKTQLVAMRNLLGEGR